jgi:hypothetical protein
MGQATAQTRPAGSGAAADSAKKRVPPFYGLYAWCSDIDETGTMPLLKDIGFKIISSMISLDDKGKTERGMLVCAKNGIEVAGIVCPNGRERKPDKNLDLDDWRKEVKDKVQRFGPGGTFWKEHPEAPNRPVYFWCVTSEPGTELKPLGDMMPDEAYFKYLQVASEELRSFSKDIVVVAMSPIGGYAAVPSMDWVDKTRKIMGPKALTEGVHKLGGAKLYDVYDMHAFTFPMPPDTGGTLKLIDWINEETGKNGGVKPIWFLDWGFATSYGLEAPFHVTKDQAADYAVRGMMLSAAHGVQCITYTYIHDQFSSSGQQGKGLRFKGYGIFGPGNKVRPLAKCIKKMIDLIPDPPKPLEKISDGANPKDVAKRSSDRPYTDSPFYCYKFQGVGDDEVIVAWTEGRPFRYEMKVKGDKVVLYNREMLGGIVYSKENGSLADGTITVPITGTPIFISTKVTPAQEKATIDYLRPAKMGDWKPIAGAED